MAKQRLSLCMLVLLLAALCLPAQGMEVARVQVTSSQVQFDPQVSYERLVLTVSTPGGNVIRREFAVGQAPVFELAKGGADGSYVWELRVAPRIDSETRKALAAARESGNAAAIQRLQKSGRLPAGELVQSGFFSVAGGAIVAPDQREERPARQAAAAKAGLPTKDVVTADDFIIQGSLCVGLDCVNNESFGFDTIRLKENNTRIKFEDTSRPAPASPPRLAAHRQRLRQRRRQQVLDRGHHRLHGSLHGDRQRADQLHLRRLHGPRRPAHLDPGARPPRQHQQHPGHPAGAEQLRRLHRADLGRRRQRGELLRPRRDRRLAPALPHPARRADQLDRHQRRGQRGHRHGESRPPSCTSRAATARPRP